MDKDGMEKNSANNAPTARPEPSGAVEASRMKEFTMLSRRQAGEATVAHIVGALALSGAAIYGVLAAVDHQRDQELFEKLKVSASSMKQETQAIGGIREYFGKEAERLEQYHEKNQTLLSKEADLGQWLSAIPGAPTLDELRQEEAQRYA